MNAAYRGRVRTGCLACRASKVKCDEQHPVCRRCTRQKKPCVYTKKRTSSPVQESPPKAGWPLSSDLFHGTQLPSPAITSHELFRAQSRSGAYLDLSPPASTAFSPQQSQNRTTSISLSIGGQSPSLLSTLISQDIYLCTTIDLLAAKEGRPSFAEFQDTVNHPFITSYDPANWASFKTHVVDVALHSTPVATAAIAVQACHQARRLSLPQTKALASYKATCEILESGLSTEDTTEHFDLFLMATFLLSVVEMLIPGELRPRLLCVLGGPLIEQLRTWSTSESSQSVLSLRLASWLLISHAAARRSGNQGLLSYTIHDLLESATGQCFPLASIAAVHGASSDIPLLATLTEPLFTFYFRMQLLSTKVADLSHYHRRRTTGADQEEVSVLMAELESQIVDLWQSRPALLDLRPGELREQFTSPTIVDTLELLATLCNLMYHTELVELGRNLSTEQVPSAEARTHLACMRSIMSLDCGGDVHSVLRSLFLYAIECSDEKESQWAILRMRQIQDPICYSEFFASFAESLSQRQRQKQRRVTTKWWCLQAFGVDPPYL